MSFLFVELILSPTFSWTLRIGLGSPGLHGKHFYPSHFFPNCLNHRAATELFVMFWLVSWHHFCSSSHIVISNGSDGQRSEIVFNFVLLVKNNWPKLHFPEVYFYIQSLGLVKQSVILKYFFWLCIIIQPSTKLPHGGLSKEVKSFKTSVKGKFGRSRRTSF